MRRISGCSPMVSSALTMKARNQVHLGLHALYLELDLIEPGVYADRDVHEVGQLGQDGDVGSQVPYLERYPVDLELWDVQNHVRFLAIGLLAVVRLLVV